MSVTAETYFSKENNMKYMGSSQFKSFLDCEARTMAELTGEYQREVTPSMLVGSYVDAYFEGTLDVLQAQHPEVFTQGGMLKSEYRQAERVIERVSRDPLFTRYMGGEKQVIKTGYIAGVPFKIKMDSYHPGKAIVDLKVMKDFAPVWVAGMGRVSFVQAWGYDFQGAIYQAVEEDHLPFYLAAATKEKEPDLAVIQIPQEYLDGCLEIVMEKAVRFQKIKEGRIQPERCGKCEYCRRTKVLTQIISMEELDGE